VYRVHFQLTKVWDSLRFGLGFDNNTLMAGALSITFPAEVLLLVRGEG